MTDSNKDPSIDKQLYFEYVEEWIGKEPTIRWDNLISYCGDERQCVNCYVNQGPCLDTPNPQG